MEEEGAFQKNRALVTLSYAVEKTRPAPKLGFSDIITNAQDTILDKKRRASFYARRSSMCEVQAAICAAEDEAELLRTGPVQTSSRSCTSSKSITADLRSYHNMQRDAASQDYAVMAMVSSSSDPVVALIRDKARLMQDKAAPAEPVITAARDSLSLRVAQEASLSKASQAPSAALSRRGSMMMRSPSLSSHARRPASPPTSQPQLAAPAAAHDPNMSSADLLLEQLQSFKPQRSRRFAACAPDLRRLAAGTPDPGGAEIADGLDRPGGEAAALGSSEGCFTSSFGQLLVPSSLDYHALTSCLSSPEQQVHVAALARAASNPRAMRRSSTLMCSVAAPTDAGAREPASPAAGDGGAAAAGKALSPNSGSSASIFARLRRQSVIYSGVGAGSPDRALLRRLSSKLQDCGGAGADRLPHISASISMPHLQSASDEDEDANSAADNEYFECCSPRAPLAPPSSRRLPLLQQVLLHNRSQP